jgi:hypothetical protein
MCLYELYSLEAGVLGTKGRAMDSQNLCLLDRDNFALVAAGFEPNRKAATKYSKDRRNWIPSFRDDYLSEGG